jgi:hypothetical protein
VSFVILMTLIVTVGYLVVPTLFALITDLTSRGELK